MVYNFDMKIKVGYIQFSPELGNSTSILSRLEEMLYQTKGADLVVLPELCNSGYNFFDKTQAWETSESISDSQFIDLLIKYAKNFNQAIVSGFNERDGNVLYNSSILITPKGFAGKYQKLHLFAREKEFFEPGTTGLPIFEYEGYRLGIQICFDWMFPEAWRVLTLKGADIICHPSNLVLPGLAQRAVPIHALINRIFTITANRTGIEGDLTFTGRSIIANPMGETILQASEAGEEIGIIEIDLTSARNKNITEYNNVIQDRKPEEYNLLTQPQENGE